MGQLEQPAVEQLAKAAQDAVARARTQPTPADSEAGLTLLERSHLQEKKGPKVDVDTAQSRLENELGLIDGSDPVDYIAEELSKKEAYEPICRALKQLSGDVWNVVDGVIPVIATLVGTGVIAVPPVGAAIGLAGLLAARAGIAVFCGDDDED